MMLRKDRVFIFACCHKTTQGELGGVNYLEGNLCHGSRFGGRSSRRENGGKAIACKIGNKATLLIDQGNGGLEYKVERNGKFFSAFRAFLHEFFGQTGKTAEVDKHRAGLKLTRKNTITVMLLNEMWQEVFQISMEKVKRAASYNILRGYFVISG